MKRLTNIFPFLIAVDGGSYTDVSVAELKTMLPNVVIYF